VLYELHRRGDRQPRPVHAFFRASFVVVGP
jgi:hypothetical protein